MKFLIDECLSPRLASVANDRGFEAYHVVHRGWGGLKDPQLLARLIDEDLVFVTNNRDDFVALVSGVELHPGLIVILENTRREVRLQVRIILPISTDVPGEQEPRRRFPREHAAPVTRASVVPALVPSSPDAWLDNRIDGIYFPHAGWWNVALVIDGSADVDSLAFNVTLPPRDIGKVPESP